MIEVYSYGTRVMKLSWDEASTMFLNYVDGHVYQVPNVSSLDFKYISESSNKDAIADEMIKSHKGFRTF